MLEVGDQIGMYEIEDALVGSGGMATVYRARHVSLRSAHALKILHPHLTADPALRKRFLEEGRLQASLRHPSIVRVTDVLSQDGIAGLVMDWLDGEDLGRHLSRAGTVPAATAAAWARGLLSALQYVHDEGVIHRDLKPENIFLQARGDDLQPVLVDFGIAKVRDLRQTATGSILGTPGYMSPEQIKDPASIDHRTDPVRHRLRPLRGPLRTARLPGGVDHADPPRGGAGRPRPPRRALPGAARPPRRRRRARPRTPPRGPLRQRQRLRRGPRRRPRHPTPAPATRAHT